MQAQDLDITRELLDSVSSARKRYFQSQKERSLVKAKSSKDCQLTELNERDFDVKHRGNTAQANNFRPSEKFRQGIVGC